MFEVRFLVVIGMQGSKSKFSSVLASRRSRLDRFTESCLLCTTSTHTAGVHPTFSITDQYKSYGSLDPTLSPPRDYGTD
jgi:hypothetical protein